MLKAYRFLSIILLISLALRLPGVFWGEIDLPRGVVLEPDEFQHVGLAADYVHQWGGKNGQALPYRFWNTRAYGFQVAILLYVGGKLGFDLSYHTKQAMIGRFLSTVYDLLLVLLLYYFALFLFDNQILALMTAALMASFDLSITYSHYALPAAAYVCWSHATLFALVRLYYHEAGLKRTNKSFLLMVFIAFGLAMTLGLKFDFLLLGITGICLLMLVFQSKISLWRAIIMGVGLMLGVLFLFLFIHGFSFSWADIKYSFLVAQEFNQNAIAQDNHWVHNPILYMMAVIGGTSIWVFLTSVLGISLFIKKRKKWTDQWPAFVLCLCFLAMEFGVRWYIDTPFIRRANVFLPLMALMSAWFFWQIKAQWRNWVFSFVLVYTLGLSISSQYNFWEDTRYQALSYLRDHPLDGNIYYSTYAQIPGMPTNVTDSPETADFLIVHETYYGRYWKFFATPFKTPACCEEVYNCASETLCQFYQQLLANQGDFDLIKSFNTLSLFPERIWFKHWFGTYETFLGDIKIYKRRK
ncbi:MAG: hypothetical protein R2828_30900 [Saprospiraceae bacterium]